jgi:UvrD/REP helicase N-terminal domain
MGASQSFLSECQVLHQLHIFQNRSAVSPLERTAKVGKMDSDMGTSQRVPIAGWIASALPPEQQKPFGSTSNRLNIRAGAGSGKTRTLSYLLAHELSREILAPSIIAFTFMDKAADEMLPLLRSGVRAQRLMSAFLSIPTRV